MPAVQAAGQGLCCAATGEAYRRPALACPPQVPSGPAVTPCNAQSTKHILSLSRQACTLSRSRPPSRAGYCYDMLFTDFHFVGKFQHDVGTAMAGQFGV